MHVPSNQLKDAKTICELLSCPERWAKSFTDAVDKYDYPVWYNAPQAYSWSVIGAMKKVYADQQSNWSVFLQKLDYAAIVLFRCRCILPVTQKLNPYPGAALQEFEFHPHTMFADVRKVIEYAQV